MCNDNKNTPQLSRQIDEISQHTQIDIRQLTHILKSIKKLSKELDRNLVKVPWDLETLQEMAVELNKYATKIHTATNKIKIAVVESIEVESEKPVTSYTDQ